MTPISGSSRASAKQDDISDTAASRSSSSGSSSLKSSGSSMAAAVHCTPSVGSSNVGRGGAVEPWLLTWEDQVRENQATAKKKKQGKNRTPVHHHHCGTADWRALHNGRQIEDDDWW